MNPFESGERKVIPAVLVYARQEGRVLMIHRNAEGRPGDYHAGKWNGLGGKCEADESARDAAAREFTEEAGITVDPGRFQPLGTIHFPNFKAHKNEDWLVFVFTVDLGGEEAGRIPSSCGEGDLHWVSVGELAELNLWPGDRHFMPFVVEAEPFSGTIWYDGPRVTGHEVFSLRVPARPGR